MARRLGFSERAIQVVRGADERQMRERLRHAWNRNEDRDAPRPTYADGDPAAGVT